MDGISRSRGWDKEIPHGVLPMEQLVLSDKWARIRVSFIWIVVGQGILAHLSPKTSCSIGKTQ